MVFILDIVVIKKIIIMLWVWRYIIRDECYELIKELFILILFWDFDWVFFFVIWIIEFRVIEKCIYGLFEYLCDESVYYF